MDLLSSFQLETILSAWINRKLTQLFYDGVEHCFDRYSSVLCEGRSFEVQSDLVLLSFVYKVLMLHSPVAVQITLVSNEDYYWLSSALTLHHLLVFRETSERVGHID